MDALWAAGWEVRTRRSPAQGHDADVVDLPASARPGSSGPFRHGVGGDEVAERPEAASELCRRAAAVYVAESDALRELVAGLGAQVPVAVIPPVPVALPAREREAAVLAVYSAAPLTWEAGYEDALVAIRMLVDRGLGVEYRIPAAGPFVDAVEFARYQLGSSARSCSSPSPPATFCSTRRSCRGRRRRRSTRWQRGGPSSRRIRSARRWPYPPGDPEAAAAAVEQAAGGLARLGDEARVTRPASPPSGRHSSTSSSTRRPRA